jgi:hypothetical protein
MSNDNLCEIERILARDKRRQFESANTIPKSAMTLGCTLLGFAIGVICVVITVAVTS